MTKKPAPEPTPKLTAETLKSALWETLNGIKGGTVQASDGDAIASQAREILRTVKVQAAVARQSNRQITSAVIDFAESTEK
jgi:hypothetical protein